MRFDWLTFDEGYGSKRPLLTRLSLVGQKFGAAVPVHFAVQVRDGTPAQRAAALRTAQDAQRGQRFRVGNRTRAAPGWRAARVPVRGAEQE